MVNPLKKLVDFFRRVETEENNKVKLLSMCLKEAREGITFTPDLVKGAHAILERLSKIAGNEAQTQAQIEDFILSFERRDVPFDVVGSVYALIVYGKKGTPLVDKLTMKVFFANLLAYFEKRVFLMAYNRGLIPSPTATPLSNFWFLMRGLRKPFEVNELAKPKKAEFGQRSASKTLDLWLQEVHKPRIGVKLEENAQALRTVLSRITPARARAEAREFLNAMELGNQYPTRNGIEWDLSRMFMSVATMEKGQVNSKVLKIFLANALFRFNLRVLKLAHSKGLTKEFGILAPHRIKVGIKGIFGIEDKDLAQVV